MKLSATEMIAQVVAAPLAAALMRRSNWVALGLSSFFLVAGGLVGASLPETHSHHRRENFASPHPSTENELHYAQEEQAHPSTSFLQIASRLLFHSFEIVKSFAGRPAIILSLAVFFVASSGAQSWGLLLQYVSKRFGWEYAAVSQGPSLSLLVSDRSIGSPRILFVKID